MLLCIIVNLTEAQSIPFDQEKLVNALNQELSGESAKRNLEFIARQHRMRGSEGYTKSVNFLMTKLKEYNLEDIETIAIPTDGKTFYGTQKSRPAWDVEFAELWEVKKENDLWEHKVKIADWESIPMVVAQDSHSGNVTAALVDIGTGTSEEDYADKSVKGKLVLTSSQPGSVVALAIKKYGALGILSYAQNQVTAWWKENDNLIRWGHLDTFSDIKTFGFMVSLKQARSFQDRLSLGEEVVLHAKVKAQQHNANYDILTAIIKGSDEYKSQEEIAFTCHLDHPRPGANDNASGCVAILEVARTLKKLIDEGRIQRPKRTIRFLWSPEIEGTTALLNFKPELAKRIKFNIHMDMVGGGPETKALFHVSRSPMSLPNFFNDIGEAFGHYLNLVSDDYASGVDVNIPMVSEEGGKEALQAVLGNFHMGSDYEVFVEGSFKIPAIYLHDWPDRYIHTNYDTAANIDPTKLKRSGFIGAASAMVMANFDDKLISKLITILQQQVLKRSSKLLEYCSTLDAPESENAKYYFWDYEIKVLNSIKANSSANNKNLQEYMNFILQLQQAVGKGKPITSNDSNATTVFTRNLSVKGPMSVFGYNYFFDHYGTEKPRPDIFGYTGIRGSGSEYAYEALNLVNGKHNVQEIRNMLSAEFGPIPLEYVNQYLEALKQINILN
ncbi:MAG: DUF4910 domain-containing protein [Flavobacteriaceae bacterium]|nr:DUF4910 domain-containing protein [Flavobacteriaceae bacterium]